MLDNLAVRQSPSHARIMPSACPAAQIRRRPNLSWVLHVQPIQIEIRQPGPGGLTRTLKREWPVDPVTSLLFDGGAAAR